MMSAQSKQSLPDSLPANAPIELVTENGFSILRPWESARVPPPLSGNYGFLVRKPHSLEREITVEIPDDIVVQIAIQTSGRILPGNSFWICCAERHLATYLWENDDYPLGDKLRVKQLDPEDIMMAIRWGTG